MSTASTATITINGHTGIMTLGPVESDSSDSDRGGWRNGTVEIAGRRIHVGGGWIHSAESALHQNRCHGLQTDTHPEMYWPGAVGEGEFAPYEGYECGDLDGLAAAVGLDIDRDTECGDRTWRMLVETVRDASSEAAGIKAARAASPLPTR